MRISRTLITSTPAEVLTTTSTTKATIFSPPAIVQKSPWHSPLPYLFGGLAAMLGLIAFALLILACSYWRLSRSLNNEENGDNSHQRDLEGGDEKFDDSVSAAKSMPVFEEKIVVIMAGDVKPTYLATPVSNRALILSSFEDATKKIGDSDDEKVEKVDEKQKLQERTDSTQENH